MLQQRCAHLEQECDSLRTERTVLTDRLHHLETELNRYTQNCIIVCEKCSGSENKAGAKMLLTFLAVMRTCSSSALNLRNDQHL